MFLACTKNMSYLKESPRGSVNTQSFITTFMYLQNESEGGMFRRVASNRRFAGILGERRVSPIDFFRHVDRVNAYSSCQRRAGFASSKSRIIVDRAQIFEYNDLSNAHNFTAQRERDIHLRVGVIDDAVDHRLIPQLHRRSLLLHGLQQDRQGVVEVIFLAF